MPALPGKILQRRPRQHDRPGLDHGPHGASVNQFHRSVGRVEFLQHVFELLQVGSVIDQHLEAINARVIYEAFEEAGTCDMPPLDLKAIGIETIRVIMDSAIRGRLGHG